MAESRFKRADRGDPAAILAAIGHPHGQPGWLDPREPIALVFGSLVLEQLDAPGQVIAELVATLASGYVAVTRRGRALSVLGAEYSAAATPGTRRPARALDELDRRLAELIREYLRQVAERADR